jgi:probable phosphoglycerate mutase
VSGRRLLLWRHGRTEWNADGRMQGQADVPLDGAGLRQAAEAAPLLALERPDTIVSSDLARALVTAEALGSCLGRDVAVDSRLRESGFGPWQGLTAEQIAARYPSEFAAWRAGLAFSVPGIEPFTEVAARMVAAIDDALDATDGTVVIVSHGAAVRRAVGALLHWPDDVLRAIGPLGNCRWTELRHTATGWRLHAHNVGPLTPLAPSSAMDVEPPSAEYMTPAH